MAGNLRKFVNPKFVKTIDLGLMKALLERHAGGFEGFAPDALDGDEAAARRALHEFLAGPEERYPEGLKSDLHRIAELGDGAGLEILEAQAERMGVDLFPELRTADGDAPEKAHDPKHIAVRAFLDHPSLFEIAADRRAMTAADRLHQVCGREGGVPANLTDGKLEAFRLAASAVFRNAFMSDFCRVGDYVDEDETNLVVSHGRTVDTIPVVRGRDEEVVAIRRVNYAILRYSEETGVLGVARVRKREREEIAELFASIVLERPRFFAGDDAEDLYTLRPIEKAGFGFRFDARYDPEIEDVRIIEAAADLVVPGARGGPRVSRSLRSRDLSGGALQRLAETPADFGGPWRLGELVFRVTFRSEGGRRPQVTVKLRPPAMLQFRRKRNEARIMELIRRHGLLNERGPSEALDAAE